MRPAAAARTRAAALAARRAGRPPPRGRVVRRPGRGPPARDRPRRRPPWRGAPVRGPRGTAVIGRKAHRRFPHPASLARCRRDGACRRDRRPRGTRLRVPTLPRDSRSHDRNSGRIVRLPMLLRAPVLRAPPAVAGRRAPGRPPRTLRAAARWRARWRPAHPGAGALCLPGRGGHVVSRNALEAADLARLV
jgi:hypothetical protein